MSNRDSLESMDAGEKESILDAFRSDYRFCMQHEEQLKLVGIEIPKLVTQSSSKNA